MALKIADLSKQDFFVWDQDPDKGTDKECRFHFRMLDSYERGYLQDQMTSLEGLPRTPINRQDEAAVAKAMESTEVRTEINKVAVLAFRLACCGIDNLYNEDDKAVEFKEEDIKVAGKTRSVVHDDIVRALPTQIFLPFYMNLMRSNNLSSGDRGNSEEE